MNSDKYNSERKIILKKLDEGREVSILELGMYELTPYFKDDSFDVGLYESIMLNKNLERRIEHVEKEMFFAPAQQKAFNSLIKNDRVIVSAPTSFGKTLLIKEYIYKYKLERVVYIVPTNALAYELERTFKDNDRFSDYIIFDKCNNSEMLDNDSDNMLFIGTQEKYLEIKNVFNDQIDLFVIDEAYKLQESVINERAYKLSESFLDSIDKESKKIFLLTPTARIKGFDKYGFVEFKSTYNAVDKNYIVLDEKKFF